MIAFPRAFEQFEEEVKRIIENTYDCTVEMAEKNQRGHDMIVYMKDDRVIAVQCKCFKNRRIGSAPIKKFIGYMKEHYPQKEFDEGWLIAVPGIMPAAIDEAKEENERKISLGTVRSNKIDWDYENTNKSTDSRNTSTLDNSAPLFENLDRYCYIGVFANKGGTGKTTIAAHLAGAFSLLGHDVIVLDIDPQRNLKKLFHNDEGNADFFVKPIPPKKIGNVIEILDEKEWEEEKENFPDVKIVICDCNPTFQENPIELIKEFNYCIIPTSLNPLGISKNSDVIKRTFDKIRTKNKEAEINVLVNYYDESKGKSRRTELLLDLVKNEIPFDEKNNLYLIDPVETCAIHRSDSLFYWGMHIVEKRKPELAFNNGPTSRVREDFLKLAKHFLKKSND